MSEKIGDTVTYTKYVVPDEETRAKELAQKPYYFDDSDDNVRVVSCEYEVQEDDWAMYLTFPNSTQLSVDIIPADELLPEFAELYGDTLLVCMEDWTWGDEYETPINIQAHMTVNQAKHLARFLTEWVKEQEEQGADDASSA